ncbi:MAG: hypothetical protein AVDCRST_MAG93-953 [uncultured Chloroflexia bacterium]|uniref:Uncharacterized protein n=1 Tax=uncultured Chloroflexia bacterium TaxID=1672391 RepID=A0A6J4HSI3_9CHLR|nr:MAG: hypothetical protein AVDCRST_MAG93-953 [uncultured Chloroflexia bacterium]
MFRTLVLSFDVGALTRCDGTRVVRPSNGLVHNARAAGASSSLAEITSWCQEAMRAV